jgi:hypothetical protein
VKGNGKLPRIPTDDPTPDHRNHPCRADAAKEDAKHDCCFHKGGDPRPQTISVKGQLYQISVQTQTCCWHGSTRLVYNGVAEAGHGPFIGFVDQEHRNEPLPLKRTGSGLVLQ